MKIQKLQEEANNIPEKFRAWAKENKKTHPEWFDGIEADAKPAKKKKKMTEGKNQAEEEKEKILRDYFARVKANAGKPLTPEQRAARQRLLDRAAAHANDHRYDKQNGIGKRDLKAKDSRYDKYFSASDNDPEHPLYPGDPEYEEIAQKIAKKADRAQRAAEFDKGFLERHPEVQTAKNTAAWNRAHDSYAADYDQETFDAMNKNPDAINNIMNKSDDEIDLGIGTAYNEGLQEGYDDIYYSQSADYDLYPTDRDSDIERTLHSLDGNTYGKYYTDSEMDESLTEEYDDDVSSLFAGDLEGDPEEEVGFDFGSVDPNEVVAH